MKAIPAILECKGNDNRGIREIARNRRYPAYNKINKILATIACYGSIRAGREMKIEEMNELLRQMEKTPYSGQCNHGRPTYIELKLSDIEKKKIEVRNFFLFLISQQKHLSYLNLVHCVV